MWLHVILLKSLTSSKSVPSTRSCLHPVVSNISGRYRISQRHEEIRMSHIYRHRRACFDRAATFHAVTELHLVNIGMHRVRCNHKRGHGSSMRFGIRDWRVSVKNIRPRPNKNRTFVLHQFTRSARQNNKYQHLQM